MSLLLGDMLVRYRGDITDLTAKTAAAIGEVEGFAGSAKVAGAAIAGGFLLAGGAAIAFTAASTKMAGDFQQQTSLLVTSAGEIPKNLDMIRQGLLRMSVDTATSTKDLTTGMFNIESAGYHGAQALMVERTAAQGAKVENSDLAAVTDVLTTAMHNYREPASQAVDVMNSMRMSAAMGKMHMDDLTGAMKNVLPIASLAKVKLTDVEAALSTMSLSGDKGASAGTHLAQMLLYLLNPSTKARKELNLVGLTSQEVATEMQHSLPDALKTITDAVGKEFPKGSQAYIAAIATISGGNKSLKAMLMTTGSNMNDFKSAADQLAPTMKAASTQVDGWAIVQGNFNFKMDAAKNALEALMITVGTKLLPKFGQVLDMMTPLIGSFSDWIVKSGALDGAIQNTVGGIQTTISIVQGIVGFYQQWQDQINLTATALVVFFTPALIASGVQATIAAAKITYQFVASLIATGLNGWAAAAKLAFFIGATVASGVQASIAGGIIATRFIASLIATVVQAGVTAYMLTGSLIPALYAMGVAFWAATGPIGLAVGAIALLGAAMVAMKQKSDDMQLGMTYAVDTMGNHIERSTGRIIQVHQDMQKQVQLSYDQMNFWGQKDTGEMTATAQRLFDQMTGHVKGDYSQLLQATKDYWNNIAAYIDNKSALAANAANFNFARIHYPNLSGGILNKNFGGYASGTDYATPGYHWVGERGKELILFNGGEQVVPSNQINHYSGSGSSSAASYGGMSGNQTFILEVDSVQLAKITGRATDRVTRLKLGMNGRAA